MSADRTKAGPRRTGSPPPSAETAEERAVVRFLTANPDFFERRPELLTLLEAPQRDLNGDGGDGRIVDLQHALNDRLRGEIGRLKATHEDLIDTGRQNLATQTRVHKCVLALLTARTFEQLIQTVTTDWAVLLDVDVVTLCVERATDQAIGGAPRLAGVHVVDAGMVDDLLGDGRGTVLLSSTPGDPAVFAGAAGLVCSSAMVRLQVSESTPPGLLALGSRDPTQFQPGQGRELLRFLAEALALSIRNWLEIPD